MAKSLAYLVLLVFSLSVHAEWIQWKSSDGGNDNWYSVYNYATDWESANTYAASLPFQAFLVTITSLEENQFVENTFLAPENYSNIYWIGATDTSQEGEWVWVNGEEMLYTNWNGNEPNDDRGGEDYGTINWHAFTQAPQYGTWNDTPVNGTVGYYEGVNDGPYMSIIEATENPDTTNSDLIVIDTALMPDQNNNGTEEVAVLNIRASNNKSYVTIRDSLTGQRLKTIRFGNDNLSPQTLKVHHDLNNNGAPDITVLFVRNSDNKIISVTRDYGTKTRIRYAQLYN